VIAAQNMLHTVQMIQWYHIMTCRYVSLGVEWNVH